MRISGIESEAEFGFAALRQLVLPFLASLDDLPEPRRQPLAAALGCGPTGAPDRFLVGSPHSPCYRGRELDRKLADLLEALDIPASRALAGRP